MRGLLAVVRTANSVQGWLVGETVPSDGVAGELQASVGLALEAMQACASKLTSRTHADCCSTSWPFGGPQHGDQLDDAEEDHGDQSDSAAPDLLVEAAEDVVGTMAYSDDAKLGQQAITCLAELTAASEAAEAVTSAEDGDGLQVVCTVLQRAIETLDLHAITGACSTLQNVVKSGCDGATRWQETGTNLVHLATRVVEDFAGY